MSKAPASSSGVRKLVIKPFKVQPKLPENFFLETWVKLQSAIQAVYLKSASAISKEELYRAVEDLCVQKHAAQVYEKLTNEIATFSAKKVTLLRDSTSLDASTFLQQVETIWTDHCEQLSTIRNIFLYLDRSYAVPEVHQGIIEVGHNFFRNELVADNTNTTSTNIDNNNGTNSMDNNVVGGLVHRIIVCILHLLSELRHSSGGIVTRQHTNEAPSSLHRDTLACVCRMLSRLDLYSSRLEPLLLHDATMFYRNEGMKKISELSVSHFLLLVEQRISETLDWTFHILELSSRKHLLKVLENEMLVPHVSVLLEGFASLVDELKLPDLKRLARLLGSVSQLDLLKQQLLNYIKVIGTKLYQILDNNTGSNSSNNARDRENRENRFIEDMLDFQDKMERVAEEALKPATLVANSTNNTSANNSNNNNNNSNSNNNNAANNQDIFKTALNSGFEFVINVQPRFVAEQLAKYVDKKLRGEQGVSEAEAEVCLSRAMRIFKLLAEKDIFEAFYKRLLAKRLLLEKSASNDLERNMLSRLKAECGAQFTSKLEGMFSDLDISAQCLTQFRTYLANCNTNVAVDNTSTNNLESSGLGSESFQLWLLTQGHWPNANNATTNNNANNNNNNVSEDTAVSLPRELIPLKDKFQMFYETHFQGRRLLWAHALSRAIVSVSFYNATTNKNNKVYDLDVTLFQALVLRCFSSINNYHNNNTKSDNATINANSVSLTVSQVSQMTGLSFEEAKLCLLSFNAPLSKPSNNNNNSTKLLLKHTNSQNNLDLLFEVNLGFESRLRRMKVAMLAAVRNPSTGQSLTSSTSNTSSNKNSSNVTLTAAEVETAQTLEEVFRERAYQVDAAIVRIMKARKRLLHSQLMAEVMQQLRFPAQNADIKKRIEALIERDYLERDPEDVTFYKYLA